MLRCLYQARSLSNRSAGGSASSTCASRSTRPATCSAELPRLQQLIDRHEIPQALGHLLALDLQEAVVHPDVRHDAGAEGAARLGDLVLVVREDQVEPAAVDVEDLAQIAACSWPSIRCASRGGRGPRGCPSPAPPARRASTARSPPGCACGPRPRRGRRPAGRRACAATARRSPAWRRRRTAPRPPPHRHGRARSGPRSSRSSRGCCRWRAAARWARGSPAPSRRQRTGWPCVSVTLADGLVQRQVREIPQRPGVDLVVDVGDVADIGDVVRRRRCGAAAGTARRRR